MSSPTNILVVDDEESMRIGCTQALAEEGHRVRTAENGQRALALIGRESFDVILLDLKMPGIAGMDVLRQIKESDPTSIVIVITGHATVDVAVEAMREGAHDFITKPFTPEALAAAVAQATASRRRLLEHGLVDLALNEPTGPGAIVGKSPAIMKVIRRIQQVAPTDSTVLIHGETGVGKELVARTIHHLSARRDGPFVVVDCGTLVESLFESEIFGHARGAFTGAVEATRGKFELANGGTIFLDEIANITVNIQSRLLRVIQEKEITKVGSIENVHVDVRILSATNKDLAREIETGRFRQDLFYRLNVVPIHLPPLRERREDIPPLVDHFLARSALDKDPPGPRVTDEAMQQLRLYDWPGNVRELKNTIECATVTCQAGEITPNDLTISAAASPRAPADGSLASSEKREIVRVLEAFEGNRSQAARHLGISRKTLREKIRKYGIDL